MATAYKKIWHLIELIVPHSASATSKPTRHHHPPQKNYNSTRRTRRTRRGGIFPNALRGMAWREDVRFVGCRSIKYPLGHSPFAHQTPKNMCPEFLGFSSRAYYNEFRIHSGRADATPVERAAGKVIEINLCRCNGHCRGLLELPIAA